MRNRAPTVQELKAVILETPIRVQERVSVSSEGKTVFVRGTYNEEADVILVSRTYHREWGGADDAVLTVIHEAIHKARPLWPEKMVRQHEFRYYKSRTLREAAAVRLLNAAMFGNDWEKVAR